MRQKQIRTRDARREAVTAEPMLEGVVPLDSRGRRNWKKMSDCEMIQHARHFIKEKRITTRNALANADLPMYRELSNRKLMDRLGLPKTSKIYASIGDEELVSYTTQFMQKNRIDSKVGLQKKRSGLYHALSNRGVLVSINFGKKRRDWTWMSDSEMISHTKALMAEKGLSSKSDLIEADSGLFQTIKHRGLLDRIGFEERQRNWKAMSDEELVETAKRIMREKKLTKISELNKAAHGIMINLKKRGLLCRIDFKRCKSRSWASMSDNELVEFAKSIVAANGIQNRKGLVKADAGLHDALYRRKLLGRIPFIRRKRESRNWESMSDDGLVGYAESLLKEKGITGRDGLREADRGLYEILQRRSLFSNVFADIEKTKRQSLENQFLSGLRLAPEAMEKFGEGK